MYRQLGELFPKSPEAPLLMGLVLAQQGRKDEARKAFARAQEVAPNYLPALEQLVDLDLKEKQYATALKRVEKQLEKDSKAPEPRLLEAKIFLAQSNTNQAEAVLLKAIQSQPDFRGRICCWHNCILPPINTRKRWRTLTRCWRRIQTTSRR